ncbi:serine hydrolase domain-containing protein [Sphingosinicella sp. LHD-64]|uniref:serine hydrolase domain-containing protein n=1 Tax=Sphingosinicella sp. LHD-64 TaxID=3072139 RepID=UPI00280CB773|nr:serine hydrolase domain-containing protein [Sphingosinicella sp. LHD-64]MDQ8757120.1 serine hydrolase domain-containing protein [Sphingosinicella sp. LHD-64]
MMLSSRRGFLGGAAAGLASALLPSSVRATLRFDSFVAAQMMAAHIPGLALGIARDGAVSFTRAYGYADLGRRQPATTDTMFHIASVTKVITAQAVMLLVDAGRIALDDPIAPHLDFAILGEAAAAITFRHLLMHMSGISDAHYYEIDFRQRGADASMEIGTLLRGYLAPGGRYARGGNLTQTPGARWDYSNIGYALLGYLVGRIAGQDMRDLTRERLFRPLGLGHIAWTIAETPARLRATPYDLVGGAVAPVEPVGFPDWPAGMIRASIDDLTLLMAAAANGGVARSERLSSEAVAAEMLRMQKPPGLPDWLTGHGLGWQQSLLDGVPRINHWGGDPGVFTMAYLDPARRIAIVILSNLSVTPESRTALKAIAARMLA